MSAWTWGLGETLTGQDIGVVDANTAALGVAQMQLMESSGHALARAVRAAAAPDDRIAIVAGRGNNGGDAFVTARFLDDLDVRVHLLGRPETIGTEIARANWGALATASVERRAVGDSRDLALDDPDVIVDAMLGTGITGELREPVASAAQTIQDTDATVIAADVPSGLDAATGDCAPGTPVPDRVVTFHRPKPGLSALDAPVETADIGVPAEAERALGPGDLGRLDRPADSHKGDGGRILVVGGGPYAGAPALAALAALRAGADLVRVVAPESVADSIQGYAPDLIVESVPGERIGSDHVDRLVALATERDAVVVGPGLGGAEDSRAAVADLLGRIDGRVVADAEAIDAAAAVETDADLVVTPHRGEFARVGRSVDGADEPALADAVATAASDLDATVLLKGPTDVISNGERVRVNRTGNAGMTVGGTGDVLAGTVGALLAVEDPMVAAGLGAFLVGRAGDRAAERSGRGLIASELPDDVGAILGEHGV
ncbi:NAD(P)H-hydrate dehydratase [Halococcoides cellulosivorans]|uniref:Bifunctional NAD(P)H-hydrate repair enzyme n=1 Tax=Halococcoides cellulosivorans TaxID=1679096 RepID=A0A2R4WXP4_9EURY|nr:NAD(P)H-hydrate dehydratase [Halococcoides cellulosivorans]AWB26312.1 bifunctional ADP-dependent NAD(P)H-hydrate dehydratase/NAD(P)H-hydrate epimerase [Halococcoides cellulosivorans]